MEFNMSKGLEAARAARAAMLANGETVERLDPIQKAAARPQSLRLAINAKCFDCQGGPSDAGIRNRISVCTVQKCPLHPVRPYQREGDDEGGE
jgi:hypothetical protein